MLTEAFKKIGSLKHGGLIPSNTLNNRNLSETLFGTSNL